MSSEDSELRVIPNEQTNDLDEEAYSPVRKSKQPKKPMIAFTQSLDYSPFSNTNSPNADSPNKRFIPIYSANKSMSPYHSSSTLRHSISSSTIPKATRFYNSKESQLTSSVNLRSMPSTLSPISSSFGYGKKKIMTDGMAKKAALVPGPNRYTLKSEFEEGSNKKRGKSFGLSYSAYSKNYIPGYNMLTEDAAKEIPGPGEYSVTESIGKDKKKYSFKSRQKWFYDIPQFAPPPDTYHPKHTENSRFTTISFGKGSRCEINGKPNSNPGPAQYKLPSVFDKYAKLKDRFPLSP